MKAAGAVPGPGTLAKGAREVSALAKHSRLCVVSRAEAGSLRPEANPRHRLLKLRLPSSPCSTSEPAPPAGKDVHSGKCSAPVTALPPLPGA